MYKERDYLRYQEYLASKRQNIIGDLGNVALSPFTFGIIEAAEPNDMIAEKPANRYTPNVELGSLALRTTIAPHSFDIPKDDIGTLVHGYSSERVYA